MYLNYGFWAWAFNLWFNTLQSRVPQELTQGSDKTTGNCEAKENVPVLCAGLLWGLLMVNAAGALL